MKRAVAALLVALMLAGTAFAEAPEFAVEASGATITAPAEDPIKEYEGLLYANDGETAEGDAEEDVAEPTVISISKNKTMTVWLGTSYRFLVSGKTAKSYGTSSKKIAAVDNTGLIALKKSGTVKITAKLKSGKKVVLTLKVSDPLVPAGVAINEGKEILLNAGDTVQLTAAVSPATAPQDVTWASGKSSVATVDGTGLVTAMRTGTASITATTPNKKKASFTVNVRTAPYMISHAMGGIDGKSYSNCLEAFLENYAEGHRIFEVDIQYTSDGKMVLWHDWKTQVCNAHIPGEAPSFRQFMGWKIYNRYTPLSLDDLLKLMRDYPDIRVVTDGRCTSTSEVKKQFSTIVSSARSLGAEDALDRFVIELYNDSMLKAVKSVYPFKAYMVTLYKKFKKAPTKSELKSVASYCKKNGVTMLAMYSKWWKASYIDILRQYGVDAALYTTNGESETEKFFKQGVTALFTDFLPPI